MTQVKQLRGWIGALAPALLLVAGAALAAPAITGYGSVELGMSPDEVRERLAADGVTEVTEEQTADGDLLIDGRLGGAPAVETDLRYVFPAGSDRLALVVAFHPEVADQAAVKEQLTAEYGQPWEEEMAEWWLEQLAEGMPATPLGFSAWGGDEQQRNRFVRLWTFEEYLTVEYLDTRLLSGRQ
ncbi:hypothetical protein [Halomonas sp. A11-A]|jgi:hypothetical protein|uniref:hypothetical protein n=1 Tax=Halomonas sp. A11-A TaxID=2183985 RepID=UPI000D718D80|nr:hypothetical protein [Halomonas sp. A11-A]PWV76727.1 hypothetical protein DER72_10872 [Halomonas sp. A11-A]